MFVYKLDPMADEHKQRKRVKIKLPAPKYDKTYTLEESAMFRPWKVDLKVELREEDLTPVTYTVYLRAPSPTDALFTACAVFQINERTNKGLTAFDEFPRLHTTDANSRQDEFNEAEALTEDQYMEAWREAKTYPNCKAVARKDNPTLFHFKKPGWDHTGGLVKADSTTLIIPK